MFSIDKEGTRRTINAIKEKVANPEKRIECAAEIEKLIDIKQSHIWRVDGVAACCGNDICGLAYLFEAEIGILQGALSAVKDGDNNKACTVLEDYLAFIEEHYEDEGLITKELRSGNS